MITSKKLLRQKEIRHGFFNRYSSKYSRIYRALNDKYISGDKIKKNYQNIFFPNQIHSNKYIFIGKKLRLNKKRIKADAIITDQRKLPIGILTADCVPVLIYDNKRKMIAAIHAGWKGALKGIIQNVINFMLVKGCTRESIVAAIGPCIQQKSYNVGKDFKKKFLKKNKRHIRFFKTKKDIIYFDLPNFLKYELISNKITNLDTINIDTFEKRNNFFSARQSLKLKHDDYGRNISIIMIN